MEKILVSVYCLAYNHVAYIENTLKAFVAQKTNFHFEVIVHDDASTDGTTDIIRKYQKMYPDIIKPIYQVDNQYSKGIKIAPTYIFPVIRGKYIASCEGDDCWIDENKLQKQVDFLENNPDYIACVHNTYLENVRNGYRKVMFCDFDRDLTLEDVVFSGSSAYHTSSLMYRSEFAHRRPEFLNSIPNVGDYPLAIFLVLSGNVMYLKDIMSVYRKWTENSWSAREFSDNDKKVKNKKQCIKMLVEANKWSDFKYSDVFDRAILYNEYKILELQGKYSEMMKFEYKSIRSKNDYLKIAIKRFFPFVSRVYTRIKNG